MSERRIIDPTSLEWTKLRGFLRGRIEVLRAELERPLSSDETTDRRARINELRTLISAVEPNPVKVGEGEESERYFLC